MSEIVCFAPSLNSLIFELCTVESTSQVSFVTALAIFAAEAEVHIGPTLMVIICALVCEHCGKVSAPPSEIIRGMATKLDLLSRE